MKNLLIVFFVLFSVGITQAQSGIGIKGGVNLSNVYTEAGSLGDNIKESLDTRTGFTFGVFGRIGKKLYLQPEVLVATRGGEVEIQPLGGGSPELVDVKYTNLDIPILIGFRPVKFLRIMGGPVASVKLSEDMKLRDALGEYTTNTGDAFKNATYGYQFGIGVKVLGIDVDLRREGSLSDINQLKFTQEPQFSQRTAGWQLTLGFKII